MTIFFLGGAGAGAGSSTISSITIGPMRAEQTSGLTVSFVERLFVTPLSSEEDDEVSVAIFSSSSSMATRRIAARAAFVFASLSIFRAFSVSRTSSASLGSLSFFFLASIVTHSSKSSSALSAASSSFASSTHAPRRSRALKFSGSSAKAASQSFTASDQRLSFMYAAARFANGAGVVASSAMETSYASIAERYSRALNSSLPFSFSLAAAHRRSRAGAARKPASSFSRSARVAPETDRSSVFAPAPCFAASTKSPPTPSPARRCSAASRSASVGMPSRSAFSAEGDEASVSGFVAVTFATREPRIGTLSTEASRGTNTVGSDCAAASSIFAFADHASRSATKSRTSASRSDAARLEDDVPREAMRALTTCAVVGKPSSSMYFASLFSWFTSVIALMSSSPMLSNFLRSSSVSATVVGRAMFP
mmetsp:Transcript_495/g.2032  ORF Transcript_495/g.2032 Transcript_495/m.2032 type:complete len:423 (+) Transcript_495:1676-2944(+)